MRILAYLYYNVMLCTLDVSVKTSFYIKICALVSIKRKTNRMSKLISKGANKEKEIHGSRLTNKLDVFT